MNSQVNIGRGERTFISGKHNSFLDGTKFQEIDRIGNKFNRFCMWDAKTIHSVSKFFGISKRNRNTISYVFF